MIPSHIIQELFDIRYRPSDIAIESIIEGIADKGFSTSNCYDCDLFVYLDIHCEDVEGELRIDRLNKNFQLNIKSKTNSFVILPITGDWDTICKHLELLNVRDDTKDR